MQVKDDLVSLLVFKKAHLLSEAHKSFIASSCITNGWKFIFVYPYFDPRHSSVKIKDAKTNQDAICKVRVYLQCAHYFNSLSFRLKSGNQSPPLTTLSTDIYGFCSTLLSYPTLQSKRELRVLNLKLISSRMPNRQSITQCTCLDSLEMAARW